MDSAHSGPPTGCVIWGVPVQPEPRAMLFDLDDTLYPLRSFVRSGFVACARYLDREMGFNPRETLTILQTASAGPERGRELQACTAHFGLPGTMVSVLIDVIRQHKPALRLPEASGDVLRSLRDGWRLGIVTNGLHEIQARKVGALALAPLLDTIVYANSIGDGRGKPEPEPFLEAVRRLGVTVERTVFVGNDLGCDVFGADRVGMRTVHLRRSLPTSGPTRVCTPDATIKSLRELRTIGDALVPVRWSANVA
jgi:putative hydrolase of the HAD superfamily